MEGVPVRDTLFSPYATDNCAEAVATALRVSEEEQFIAMRTMRAVVAEFNIYRWAEDLIADAARLRADMADLLQSHETGWQRELLRA